LNLIKNKNIKNIDDGVLIKLNLKLIKKGNEENYF
jgi:hypothetical protein